MNTFIRTYNTLIWVQILIKSFSIKLPIENTRIDRSQAIFALAEDKKKTFAHFRDTFFV